MTGQELRDRWFGQLFGIMAIVRSRRVESLFGSSSKKSKKRRKSDEVSVSLESAAILTKMVPPYSALPRPLAPHQHTFSFADDYNFKHNLG